MTKIAIFESVMRYDNPSTDKMRQEEINKRIEESGIKEEQIIERHCYHYMYNCSIVPVPVDVVQILYED